MQIENKPIIAKVYQDTVHFLIFRVPSTEKFIESAFNLFSAMIYHYNDQGNFQRVRNAI